MLLSDPGSEWSYSVEMSGPNGNFAAAAVVVVKEYCYRVEYEESRLVEWWNVRRSLDPSR